MTAASKTPQAGGESLVVDGLTVRYGDFLALDNLSFKANAGEVVGLIGPNGAGKTTLVRTICGQINPTAGTIKVAGAAIRMRSAKTGVVGLVPQEIGLYPFMTAEENLDVFARLYRLDRKTRRETVARALADVDMTTHAHKLVSSLSGGMKRRINVAAAILDRPKLLILDEPTAGVDVSARDAIHGLARKLAGQGLTVLLVTHELEQAELICDRVLILASGRRRHFSSPDELLSEVYAGRQQITLKLRHHPDETLRPLLAAQGFTSADGNLVWSGLGHEEQTDLIGETRALVESNNNLLQEVSVRRPGLESLLHDIATEKEASSDGLAA
ncbi:ABC transporter ATP-binding protein [Parvularcula sp. IMCC14364]|uniref:ABC transporter ATP-binding protein n=1 Tax=Parvularcula sp. IMCC14364 TaxID=3067902 RepID=UPI002742661A|nr:ABC transporter ATP-binding protein [Parvularcula sp. IMCC14364]